MTSNELRISARQDIRTALALYTAALSDITVIDAMVYPVRTLRSIYQGIRGTIRCVWKLNTGVLRTMR